MTQPTSTFYYTFQMTLKAFEDGSSITVNLTNQRGAPLTGLETSITWPVLLSIDEIPLLAGDYLPSISGGSFKVSNVIGSYGAYRKFSDVLDRYTPTDQPVTLYVTSGTNDLTGPTNTVTQPVLTGVIQDYQITYQAGTGASDGSYISFTVRTDLVKDQIQTLQVDSSLSGMSLAGSSSLGRTVPILVGDSVATQPVRISADGSDSPTWAVGSTLKGSFRNDTGVLTYTKNADDNWESFSNTTSYFDDAGTVTAGTIPLDYGPMVVPNSARIAGIPGFATSVRFTAQGRGSPGRISAATLNVIVLRYSGTSVIDEVARGSVDLSLYDTQNNAPSADFNVDVSFDKPLHMSAHYSYAYGFSVTGYVLGDLQFHYRTGGVGGFFKTDTAANANGTEWGWNATGGYRMRARFFGIGISTSAETTDVNADGFGYSTISFTQQAAGLGQTNPDFDDLPLIVTAGGLTDNGTGDVTGTPLQRLNRPDWLVKALQRRWNGSTWVDSGTEWDFSRYATSYNTLFAASGVRTRQIKGLLESRSTFSDLLEAICKATACRVGVLSNGKLFLWPWGLNQAVQAVIPEGDIAPVSWTVSDSTTVINRAFLSYNKSYLSTTKIGVDEAPTVDRSLSVDYQSTLDWDHTTNSYTSLLTSQSFALYGRKALEDVTNDWISTQTGAETYLEYLMTTQGFPKVSAEFIVPYHKYYGLEMFDVINFQHSQFPAYYGTNPDAQEPFYTDGTQYNLKGGYEWQVSKPYRGLIEGKSYILPFDQAPAIRLKVTILPKHTKDLT